VLPQKRRNHQTAEDRTLVYIWNRAIVKVGEIWYLVPAEVKRKVVDCYKKPQGHNGEMVILERSRGRLPRGTGISDSVLLTTLVEILKRP
jgi:hypothetical protein